MKIEPEFPVSKSNHLYASRWKLEKSRRLAKLFVHHIVYISTNEM